MSRVKMLAESDVFRRMIPNDLINIRNIKGASQYNTGFAHKLWNLLNWVESDKNFRSVNLGAAWVNNEEFFIDKLRFCEIMQIPVNTLNQKLRNCKFQKKSRSGRKTFWKCLSFGKNSTPEDLLVVDNRKSPYETNFNYTPQAFCIATINHIEVFFLDVQDVKKFKSIAVFLWEDIVSSSCILACSFNIFLKRITEKILAGLAERNDLYMSENTPDNNFMSYLQANPQLNVFESIMKSISYVLVHENVNIVTLAEFCIFFARFGPEESIIFKIHQLLMSSSAYYNWFSPIEQKFDRNKEISGCFSNTFSNCFVLKNKNNVSYHIYNNPLNHDQSGYLFDERSKSFTNWNIALISFIG